MHCHIILVSALFADTSSLLTVLFQRNIFYFHLFPLVFSHCQIAGYSTGLASCIHLIGIHKCTLCTLPAPLQRECIHSVQYLITLN